MSWLRVYTLIFMLACSGAALAEVVVIVSKQNDLTALSRHEVVDIYMGRTQLYPNGKPAMPIDHPGKGAVKRTFYKKMMNKRPAQINAYWAKLLFTGRASPPKIVSDVKLLVEMVADNPSAIAYIDSSMLDERVKVVTRVD